MSIVTNEFSEEINYELNNHLCFNQWRSTSTVIEWVKAIENKNVCKFPLINWNWLENLLI